MTRARVGIALYLCAVSLHAGALLDEPALGSSLQALATSRYDCADTESGVRTCARKDHAGLVLEGRPVRGQLLVYRNGLLERVTTLIDESGFDPVRQALAARFGAGEASRERLRAGMSGMFDNRIVVWHEREGVIVLEQYFRRVIHSGVSVMTEAAYRALVASREASRRGGARDL